MFPHTHQEPTYNARWTHTAPGGHIQHQVDTYNARWTHTTPGGHIQCQVDTYNARWTHTTPGGWSKTEEIMPFRVTFVCF